MFSYILPTIISLPIGYNCRILIPRNIIEDRIIKIKDYKISVSVKAYRDGNIFFERQFQFSEVDKFSKIDFIIPNQEKFSKEPGYAEFEILEEDKKIIFPNRAALNFYTIFYNENKKSFLSDNAYKYGSPAVINQMSTIKKYIDAYPTVTIDEKKDLGETLVLINPYPKKILVTLITNDGRSIQDICVNPKTSHEVNLFQLLGNEEKFWQGHIQIQAKYRIITFNYKHSFKNNKIISDYEHLDPFRGEPTSMPLFQLFRVKVGDLLERLFN
jgi:hypothetical protein